MINAISSPGDPIFFMHHTFLDRIWAKWQDKDLSRRLTDIGGNNRINLTHPFHYGAPFYLVGQNESLDFPIPKYNGTNKDEVLGTLLGSTRPADVPYAPYSSFLGQLRSC